MQKEFFAALLDPELAPPVGVVVRGGADPVRRFGVYRNNVVVALVDALADSYPVVCALVGEAFFIAMAREFCRRHPPRSPVMAEYGAEFAAFIDGFAPANILPYLSDVARLEWQRVVAWHAADAVSLMPVDVAHLLEDPATLVQTRWQFHPSLTVVSSPYAIVSLWGAHQLQSEQAVAGVLSGIDWGQAESALVFRQEHEVLVLRLHPAEILFITALRTGVSLAEAAQTACDTSMQFDLTLMFAMLLRSGVLVGYSSNA